MQLLAIYPCLYRNAVLTVHGSSLWLLSKKVTVLLVHLFIHLTNPETTKKKDIKKTDITPFSGGNMQYQYIYKYII